MVGTGGGRFDEHPKMDGQPGERNECALTLVCKDLGVFDDPALWRIIPYVRDEDCQGGNGDMFTFAQTLRVLHASGLPEAEVMGLGLKIVNAHYQSELEFAEAEIAVRKAKVVIIGSGRDALKIMVVESSSRAVNRACRRQGAGLVIQKMPSGNVQIYTDKKWDLDLRDLIRLLRKEEAFLRGDRAITSDWKKLEAAGKSDESPEWFFHPDGGWIFNGSLSSPEVPPTVIPLERIIQLAMMAMDTERFDSHREGNCRAGCCDGPSCPWYEAGLIRCRQIRYHSSRR